MLASDPHCQGGRGGICGGEQKGRPGIVRVPQSITGLCWEPRRIFSSLENFISSLRMGIKVSKSVTICVQEGTSDCGWSQSTPQVRDAEDSAGEGSAVFVRGEDDSLHVPSSGLGWPHRPAPPSCLQIAGPPERQNSWHCWAGGGASPPRPGGEGSGGLL